MNKKRFKGYKPTNNFPIGDLIKVGKLGLTKKEPRSPETQKIKKNEDEPDTIKNLYRLGKVAKELGVKVTSLSKFLEAKGLKMNFSPNTKITHAHYTSIKKEFGKDKIFDKSIPVVAEPPIFGRQKKSEKQQTINGQIDGINRQYRLIEIAKELRIGVTSLSEFLKSSGLKRNPHSNTLITYVEYSVIQEFIRNGMIEEKFNSSLWSPVDSKSQIIKANDNTKLISTSQKGNPQDDRNPNTEKPNSSNIIKPQKPPPSKADQKPTKNRRKKLQPKPPDYVWADPINYKIDKNLLPDFENNR
jgi:hypothetical protein